MLAGRELSIEAIIKKLRFDQSGYIILGSWVNGDPKGELEVMKCFESAWV